MNELLKDVSENLMLGMLYLLFVGFIIPLPGDRGAWMNHYWPIEAKVQQVEIKQPVLKPDELDTKQVYAQAIKRVYKVDVPKQHLTWMFEYAEQYGVPVELVIGLVAAESSFNPNAKSSVGAVGYAQVWPKWHQDKIAGRNIHDPKVNLEVGVRYLVECIGKRGNEFDGLACYNGSDSQESAIRYFTKVKYRGHELTLTGLEIAGI